MAKEKNVRFAGTPKMSLSPRNGFQLAAANELADDVRHYLTGQPLRAAPESRIYLARKFVGRHRAGISTARSIFPAWSVSLMNPAILLSPGKCRLSATAERATRFADSDPTRLVNWVRMTLSLSVVTAALVAAIDHVVRRMDQKRAEIESVLVRLTSSERALRTAYDELGRLHGTLMMAQEDEQRRIARELHDQFGQMLTALKLKLTLRPKSKPEST